MVSIYSVIWTIINCSLMVFILMILRRNTSFLQKYGTSALLLLTTCCTIRMMLPLEFPEHQHIISDPIFLSRIQGSYEHYLGMLSYKPLLIRIWIGGTILFIIIYTLYYLGIQFKIHSNSCPAEDHINDILYRIDPSCPMRVCISPDISVPVSAGILRSNIYLPEYRYSQTDLYYVILHEYNHWKRNDMAKKVVLYLLSSIMWWNPFSYLLRNEFIQLLEFNCDQAVTKNLDDEEVIDYLQALCNTHKFVKKNRRYLKTNTTTMEFLSTKRKRTSTIQQRFDLLLHQENVKHGTMKVVLILIILMWMVASYYYLPQPYYFPSTISWSTKNNHLIPINDMYIEETTEEKYYLNVKNLSIPLDKDSLNDHSHFNYSIKWIHSPNNIIMKIKILIKKIF